MYQIGSGSTFYPLIDIGQFRRDFPEIDTKGAGMMTIRSGRSPSTATVLMLERDYRALIGFSTAAPTTTEQLGVYPHAPFSATLYTVKLDGSLSWAGWNIVGGTRIGQFAKADGNAPVLVELADTRLFFGRYLLHELIQPFDVFGNPQGTYTDWNDLIESIWNAAKVSGSQPALNLATWADLGTVPTTIPSGFDLRRHPMPVVEKIELLLNRCGYTLSHHADGFLYPAQIGSGSVPTYTWPLWLSYQASDNRYNTAPKSYRTSTPDPDGLTVLTSSATTAANALVDGVGIVDMEYESVPTATFFRDVLDNWVRRSHRRDDIYQGYRVVNDVGAWHTSIVYWNQGWGPFTRTVSEPVPLIPAAPQNDGRPWRSKLRAGEGMTISGTITAGSFTVTIRLPDTTTVTTGSVSHNALFATVISSLQTALDTALGASDIVRVSGRSYASIVFDWLENGYQIDAIGTGSLTGAVGSSFTGVGLQTYGIGQKPTGITVDEGQGLRLWSDAPTALTWSSKLYAVAANLTHWGVVSTDLQNFAGVKDLEHATGLFEEDAAQRCYVDGSLNVSMYVETSKYSVWESSPSLIGQTTHTHAKQGTVADFGTMGASRFTGGIGIYRIMAKTFDSGDVRADDTLAVADVSTDPAYLITAGAVSNGGMVYRPYVEHYVTVSNDVAGINSGETGRTGGYGLRVHVDSSGDGDVAFIVRGPNACYALQGTNPDDPPILGVASTNSVGPLFQGGILIQEQIAGAIADLNVGVSSLSDTQTALNSVLAVLRAANLITP